MIDLTEHVTMMSRYSAVSALLLEHGTQFTEFIPDHDNFVRGMLGECYMNAGRVAHDRHDLRYVEGYAIPGTVPLPMMHAWLIDSEDRIIDPTWADGAGYFGLVIPRHTLAEITMRTGYWGVLDNLWMDHELPDILRDGMNFTDTDSLC